MAGKRASMGIDEGDVDGKRHEARVDGAAIGKGEDHGGGIRVPRRHAAHPEQARAE